MKYFCQYWNPISLNWISFSGSGGPYELRTAGHYYFSYYHPVTTAIRIITDTGYVVVETIKTI